MTGWLDRWLLVIELRLQPLSPPRRLGGDYEVQPFNLAASATIPNPWVT